MKVVHARADVELRRMYLRATSSQRRAQGDCQQPGEVDTPKRRVARESSETVGGGRNGMRDGGQGEDVVEHGTVRGEAGTQGKSYASIASNMTFAPTTSQTL